MAQPVGAEEILERLNDRQREAVCHGDEPLLIVAGAGTGKTATLAHRVAYQIASGVDPKRILLLTFTRRASTEMLKRVDSLLARLPSAGRGRQNVTSRHVWGGTFHAVATRLLRQYAKSIGLSREFTVLDRGDSEDLMQLVRRELGLSETGKRFPLKGTCVSIYSRSVNAGEPIDRTVETRFPWCQEFIKELKRLFQAYVDRKEAQQSLDYDDLLLFWSALLSDPEVNKDIRSRFDCALVDEYQDTNVLQADILKRLCPDGRGLTAVGDDAQSIYSFRGATVRNILDFPDQFPGTTIVKLEENYRSTQPILAATNQVIALARKRYVKDLWSQRDEGNLPQLVQCMDDNGQSEFVIERILEHREAGIPLRQQAVLFRASHHSLGLELELARHNIPFHKYGGLKFIETAHVKDLLSFLRLGENPLDVIAAARILLLLPGIGQKRCGDLIQCLQEARGDFTAWSDISPPSTTEKYWHEFVTILTTLRSRSSRNSDVQADVHLVRTFYAPLAELKYDNFQPRLRDLEQLEQLASGFKNRLSFLTELTLDPPSSTQDLPDDPWLDEDYLVLSTIHSAKGLEWDSVFVIHAADGNIPSDMAAEDDDQIEEELRLFYVALTRAKNRLFVCHPMRCYSPGRHRRDEHTLSQLTRFLPRKTWECFQRVVPQQSHSDFSDEKVPMSHLRTSDIRSRVKGLWR